MQNPAQSVTGGIMNIGMALLERQAADRAMREQAIYDARGVRAVDKLVAMVKAGRRREVALQRELQAMKQRAVAAEIAMLRLARKN